MEHPGFFHNAGPFTLARVAEAVGAEVAAGADGAKLVVAVRPLGEASPQDLTFVDNRKYLA